MNPTIQFITDMMATINRKSTVVNIDGTQVVEYDFSSLSPLERKVVKAYEAIVLASEDTETGNSDSAQLAKRCVEELSLYLSVTNLNNAGFKIRA